MIISINRQTDYRVLLLTYIFLHFIKFKRVCFLTIFKLFLVSIIHRNDFHKKQKFNSECTPINH